MLGIRALIKAPLVGIKYHLLGIKDLSEINSLGKVCLSVINLVKGQLRVIKDQLRVIKYHKNVLKKPPKTKHHLLENITKNKDFLIKKVVKSHI